MVRDPRRRRVWAGRLAALLIIGSGAGTIAALGHHDTGRADVLEIVGRDDLGYHGILTDGTVAHLRLDRPLPAIVTRLSVHRASDGTLRTTAPRRPVVPLAAAAGVGLLGIAIVGRLDG